MVFSGEIKELKSITKKKKKKKDDKDNYGSKFEMFLQRFIKKTLYYVYHVNIYISIDDAYC
jgi:hypothetical protein